MQMRRNYESTNKVTRIAGLRAAAKDCAAKGFPGFASVCEEQADLLQSELDYAAKQRMKAERVELDTDPEFRLPDLSHAVR